MEENTLPSVETQQSFVKAATAFQDTSKRIRGLAKSMNAKGVARVLIAVSQFPFVDKDVKFKSKVEEELFVLCLTMDRHKNIMHEVVNENEKEITDTVTENIKNEIIEGDLNV